MINGTAICRVATEPELTKMNNAKKTPVCKFRVAVDQGYKDASGEYVTDFWPAEITGPYATSMYPHLEKGRRLAAKAVPRRQEKGSGDDYRVFALLQLDDIRFLEPARSHQDGR